MSALSSYLDRKAGFEQWFIKAREGHSGLGWLKISYCNYSVKRRPPRPRPEYTNEIKKKQKQICTFRTQLIKPGGNMFDL